MAVHDRILELADSALLTGLTWVDSAAVSSAILTTPFKIASLGLITGGELLPSNLVLHVQYEAAIGTSLTMGVALVTSPTTNLLTDAAAFTLWSNFNPSTGGAPVSAINAALNRTHAQIPLPTQAAWKYLGLVLFSEATPTSGRISVRMQPQANFWTPPPDANQG
jgi:hypothetical protein